MITSNIDSTTSTDDTRVVDSTALPTDSLLLDSADRLFGDQCNKPTLDQAASGDFPATLWRFIVDNDFHQMARRDSGVALADVYGVIWSGAKHGAPLPLAEALLAYRWLDYEGDEFIVVGEMRREGTVVIPWARHASRCLAASHDKLYEMNATAGTDCVALSGEPCVTMEASEFNELNLEENPYLLLSLSRAASTAGALEQVLSLSLRYAQDRKQFGRPIASFQAMQHTLASMAAEVAAACQATKGAIAMLGEERFALEVAAARIRCAQASTLVAEAAHQVHGAIGFTQEHSLHHFTRRLWGWREEFGNETYWQGVLGRHLCELGATDADNIWDFIATRF